MPPTRRSYLRIVDRIGLRKTAALDVAGECQRGEFYSSIRAHLPMQDQQRARGRIERSTPLGSRPTNLCPFTIHSRSAGASAPKNLSNGRNGMRSGSNRTRTKVQILLGSSNLPIPV